MHRRAFTRSIAATLIASRTAVHAAPPERFRTHCASVEAALGGRLGVSCIETGRDRVTGYRADERFPICSTFKWLAAAALLRRVDGGHERLDRRIRYRADALLEWAPVTKLHVGDEGMTLGALCAAAIEDSDNTAGNLVVREAGGLAGWNRFVRSIGDAHTRLDRAEPALNEARPGDVRDTTTPAAMAADLRAVLLQDRLSATSRDQLVQWMLGTKYSGQRLRSALPEGWRLADKTGTGNSGTGTIGDVGVYWPPSGTPIVIAVYMTQAVAPPAQQEAAIADLGRWVREHGPV